MAEVFTIDDLNALTALTAADEIPVWDNEASVEPTKKITAQNLVAALITLGSLLTQSDMAVTVIDDSFTDKDSHIDSFKARKSGKTVSLSFALNSGVASGATLFNIPTDLTPVAVDVMAPLYVGSSGAIYANGGAWIESSARNTVKYYGDTTTALLWCNIIYMLA